MRIIAGEYRGRKLASVKGADMRYTAERVKGALFSILGNAVPGSRFLDLYSGSGSIGIEAISRGAEFVTFVDVNPICVKTISANLALCKLSPKPPRITLLKMGISRAMEYFRRHDTQFDVIFLDPPYRSDLVGKTLQEISACGILSTGGDVVAQHDPRENAPERVGALVRTRQSKYGSTLLSFYTLGRKDHSED